MKIVSTKKKLQQYLKEIPEGNTIGFVPTMGTLHEGHLSLLNKANAENDVSVVSIFINPTQFNDISDFNSYPRNFEYDKLLLEKRNCDILFIPEYNEIYPEKKIEWANVDLGFIEQVMEGKYRSGHFRGVKTVVLKLFEIILPDRAYFGEKDYQQLLIIEKMVKKLNLPIQIVSCETQREPDGLAMSSRNKKLTVDARAAAAKIPFILKQALRKLRTETTKHVSAWVYEQFAAEPYLQLQYFEIADQNSLKPVRKAEPGKTRVFIAVFAGDVRLIDNMLFGG